MKANVLRSLKQLEQLQIVADATVFKTSTGKQFVRIKRGRYFTTNKTLSQRKSALESPLFETLRTIGFDEAPAVRLIRRFDDVLLLPNLSTLWVNSVAHEGSLDLSLLLDCPSLRSISSDWFYIKPSGDNDNIVSELIARGTEVNIS